MTDQNDDLFSGDSTPQDNPTAEKGADLFSSMVGEGKKFKTPEDLARSAHEKDSFIEQLKSENAEMRRELERAGKIGQIDEALKRLNDRLENASGEDTNVGAMSREDILAIIREDAAKSKYEQNRKTIQAELINKMGDPNKAREFLGTKAAELGMSPTDLKSIVEKSPAAARAMLGLSGAPKASGPTPLPTSSKNSDANPGVVGERGKSYYDNLRKEMGSKFWSPQIQQQMFKDRKELGDKFNTI